MTAKGIETKYIKNEVPDEERCLFTTNHGNRCKNPHLGNATRHCILHEGRMQKVDDAEVKAVAEQLLGNNVELHTKDDVNRFTSQLLILVAQKKISRQDGSLLAYIASVLLQSITTGKRQAISQQRAEFVESVAEPIPEDRMELARRVAARVTQEPPMPGRTNNPYTYPSKWK
jgi:hypothetical protein